MGNSVHWLMDSDNLLVALVDSEHLLLGLMN